MEYTELESASYAVIIQATQEEGSGTFARYCASLHNLFSLRERRNAVRSNTATIEQLVGLLVLTLPDASSTPRLQNMLQQAADMRVACSELVSALIGINTVIIHHIL